MRAEFDKKTKLAAFRRAMGRCEGCSGLLMPGKFHYDHRNPAAFEGSNGLENCQCLCIGCHGGKTVRDVAAIAKSSRVAYRAAGIRPDRTLRAWRGFDGRPIYKSRQR